jgi:hypothetical protein
MVEVRHLENLPKKLPIFIAEIPSFFIKKLPKWIFKNKINIRHLSAKSEKVLWYCEKGGFSWCWSSLKFLLLFMASFFVLLLLFEALSYCSLWPLIGLAPLKSYRQ